MIPRIEDAIYTAASLAVDEGYYFDKAVQAFKLALVKAAIVESYGNKSQAAVLLKIHRNSIARLLGGDNGSR